LPLASIPEISLNELLIEIGQLVAPARKPTQQPANHIQASPSDVPNKPLLDETSGIEFDEMSVWSVFETTIQPASVQILFNFHLPVSPLLTAEAQNELC
jgi:hypothetical protein